MKVSSLVRFLIASACVVALSLAISAQSGRGTVTGVVTDTTGAVVPGVDLKIIDKTTGVSTTAISTDAGAYRAPYVPPGTYRITASLPGFKTAVADNIEVGVAQTVTVDFKLEVGEVSEQVTVSAKTPLLEASTPEIGTNATEKEVHTWPILVGDGTRQLQSFIFRAMPGTEGGEFAGTINGGQSYSHEILIDGISIGRYDLNGGSNNEFTPTMDAVSEFKLQTGALSAQYGNTQTALTNFGLKSGTNDYHGTVFWFHRDQSLNANSWTNNRFGNPKSPFRDNNFGGTFGGPITIPKVYDGKDRTHFFYSYEGERFHSETTSGFESLPVAPFRKGDFSLLLDPNFTKDSKSGTVVGTDKLGRPVIFGQIYNPFSARQLPDGTWIQDPFPGNIIPQNLFSQVTQRVLKEDVPLPQLFQFRRNHPRVSGCCPTLNIDNYSFKLDHVVSANHKVAGSYVYNDRYRLRFGGGGTPQISGVKIPGPFMAGDKTQSTPGWIGRFSEDWTISTSLLNHFAFGYNRFRNKNVSNSFLTGRDFAQELGLKNVGGATFPQMRMQGFATTLTGGFPTFGHQGTGNNPNGSTIIENDLTWIHGNQSFRFGFEHRRYYINNSSRSTPGRYDFHNENTALSGFGTQTGFAYASFLLGVVRSASVSYVFANFGDRSRVTGFYVQDDWKFRPNLTINLGLRWDIPTPFTEVADRMSSLDPTKPNPGADGFRGALAFLGKCSGCTGGHSFADTYWKQVGPRIGFAWANERRSIVVRGGYGINFSPPIMDGFSFPYTAGFNGSNPVILRTGRFREDPSYIWDNPYKPFTQVLPNTDPAQRNGTDIGFYVPDTRRMPYVQNWNLGVQHELPWQTKLEINYVGNKGTRLNEAQYLNGPLNQVDPKYLSLGDALLDPIASHPEIKKPYPSFSGTVAQALRPFPQYQGISTHRLNGGWSTYHALQVTGTKRTAHGLSFLAAYTFSKSLATSDTAGPGNYYDYGQNIYNLKADYAVTQYHVPHDLKLTWIYDLPVGPQGRWLREGWAGRILGGWTMSAIHRYTSGSPLSIGVGGLDGTALFNSGFRADVLLPGDQQKVGDKPSNSTLDPVNGTPYLNPKAFGIPPHTSSNVPLRLGNAPRYMPNLRGFAGLSEDFSLVKKTGLKFREQANLEFRLDATNLFNRVQFNGPSTDVTDPSSFGRIFGKGGGPRNIQLGLRLSF